MKARDRRKWNDFPPRCPHCREKALYAYPNGKVECKYCGKDYKP